MLGDSVDEGGTDQPGGVAEVRGTQLGDKLDSFIKPPECSSKDGVELRQRTRGDLTADSAQRGSHHGLEQYLSRFEEAMKLRKQLMSEKPSQEDGSTARRRTGAVLPEELLSFDHCWVSDTTSGKSPVGSPVRLCFWYSLNIYQAPR